MNERKNSSYQVLGDYEGIEYEILFDEDACNGNVWRVRTGQEWWPIGYSSKRIAYRKLRRYLGAEESTEALPC